MNRNRLPLRLATALLPCLLVGTIAPAADPAPPAEEAIHNMVVRLSDEDWRTRDKAQEQLAAMGEAAEGPLRERLKDPKLDAEERSRIEAVLKNIDEARRSGPSRVTFRKAAASPAEVLAAITQRTKVAFAPGTDNLTVSTW